MYTYMHWYLIWWGKTYCVPIPHRIVLQCKPYHCRLSSVRSICFVHYLGKISNSIFSFGRKNQTATLRRTIDLSHLMTTAQYLDVLWHRIYTFDSSHSEYSVYRISHSDKTTEKKESRSKWCTRFSNHKNGNVKYLTQK